MLEQIDGLHNFSFKVKPGLRFPLHTSAPGKAYLASLPDEGISEKIIAELKLTRFTPKTITSIAKLKEELKEVRLLGYGVDREEEMDGQVCIGAVVRNKQENTALPGRFGWSHHPDRMDEKKIEANRPR